MTVTLRTDAPLAMLRFFAHLPEDVTIEIARLQMTQAHAKSMIDVLSKALEYYPSTPGKTKKDT